MLALMIAQLCLGFVAFLTRVAWGHDAVQPELPMVVSTVAHVAVGALLGSLVYIESAYAYRFWIESKPLRGYHDYTRRSIAEVNADWDLYNTLERRNLPLGRYSPVSCLSQPLRAGLVAAAKSFCKELSEQQKVEIDFSHTAIPRSVPKEISLCLFRVLQETLQNAVKHSGVRHFKVELCGTEGEIQLTVSDLGVGFDPQDATGQETADGVLQFLVGTGGAGLGHTPRPIDNSEKIVNTYGVLRLKLYPLKYSFQFLPASGGSSLDSGERTCR
jgi:anti-sigma regulatory factor (Ser/Thr protein kinase)